MSCGADGQCQSGICGVSVSHTGNCCSTACATSDGICGATACDDAGACVYPGAIACSPGPDSCSAGLLTYSACNGAGQCALTTKPCPNDEVCNRGGTACVPCSDGGGCAGATCQANSECGSGICGVNGSGNCCSTACTTSDGICSATACDDTGACVYPGGCAGATCQADSECNSGICGVNGTGNCCSTACATNDSICGVARCDDMGTCVYPVGGPCSADTCSAGALTQSACNGAGLCIPNTVPCPINEVCNDIGSDCIPCTGAGCPGASCQANGECNSGVCGVNGTGNCCSIACATSDTTCGATACDAVGLCVYPWANACGTGPDACSAGALTHSICDGTGSCTQNTVACRNDAACNDGGTACLVVCAGATCAVGDFCDVGNGACCAGLARGGTLKVDGIAGHDTTACCGFGGTEPCQTVTKAMELIDSAGAQGVTIVATLDGGGGDWAAPETYPIALGWGVELSAAGVIFHHPDSALGPILDVQPYSASDEMGSASIVGSSTSPIGFDATVHGGYADAIFCVTTALYIANARLLNGGISAFSSDLWLGTDRTGAITGSVYIGNVAQSSSGFPSQRGIVCDNCSVRDSILNAQSSLIMQGAALLGWTTNDDGTGTGTGTVNKSGGAGIAGYRSYFPVPSQTSIVLTSNPVFGVAPSTIGSGGCPNKFGGDAVSLWGGTLTIRNGIVQCVAGTGISSSAGAVDGQLFIDNTTIQNTGIGLLASGAAVSVTNSLLRYNGIGIAQNSDAVVDLGGGGNTVICSTSVEGNSGSTWPGIDVWNASPLDLNASNVAWDTAGPDYFSCDAGGPNGGFLSCSCNLASCSTAAGADGMDAVATAGGRIILTGHTQSPNGCR
jgi:hypothetical protein